MRVTRFPYFFYFLQEAKNLVVKNNKVTINDINYELKAKNKSLFLFLRFLPIAIFFLITFNQYDFSLSNEKIVQYISAIAIFLIIIIFKRIGFIISLIVLVGIGIFTISNYFELENMAMPFIFKYLIFIFVIYDFYRNMNCKLYELLENNKLKAHLILKEMKEWKK